MDWGGTRLLIAFVLAGVWGRRGVICIFLESFTIIGLGPNLSSLDPLNLMADKEWQRKPAEAHYGQFPSGTNPHAFHFFLLQCSQTPFRPVGVGPQLGQASFRRGHTTEAWTAPVSIAVVLSVNERPL